MRSLASGAGAKAAANAGSAAVKKEASTIASGLTRGGFSKSGPKATAGAASGGCHSFASTTLVLMADGTSKQIAQVKVGDKVLAKDPTSGRASKRTVVRVHLNRDTALTALAVKANGRIATISTTQHHPFWDLKKQRWVNAGDLDIGAKLTARGAGNPSVIGKVNYVATRSMYDLTVESVHTYHVLAGATPVLVHNCNTMSVRELAKTEMSHPLHPGKLERMQKLDDDTLLSAINKPDDGSQVLVTRSRDALMEGHHRVAEAVRRAADPDSKITWDTRVRVDVFERDLRRLPGETNTTFEKAVPGAAS